jgi:TFIIF-interacting CTD phosphatase-like protein
MGVKCNGEGNETKEKRETREETVGLKSDHNETESPAVRSMCLIIPDSCTSGLWSLALPRDRRGRRRNKSR